MEQRVMNFSQKQTAHIENGSGKNNIKNINKTRIIVMGKSYIINKDTLEIYKIIGEIAGAGLMIGMFYLIYCLIWMIG